MTSTVPVDEKTNARGWSAKIESASLVLALMAALVAVGAVTTDGFFTVGNLGVVVEFAAPTLVVALGLATVVLGKGIDLSVGAMAVVGAQVSLELMTRGLSEFEAITLVGLAAVLFGLLNGIIVALVGVPALIATLATSQLLVGGVKIWLLDRNLYRVPGDSMIGKIAYSDVFGIPASIVAALVVTMVAVYVWQFTGYGRVLRAIGDNFETARTSGAPVKSIQVSSYVISAVLAYLAGFLIASREGSITTTPTAFNPMIFIALTAVVIGGVSLAGGIGNVSGVVVGTLFIGLVTNLLVLNQLPQAMQSFAQAATLLVAIGLDAWLHPRDEETARSGEL